MRAPQQLRAKRTRRQLLAAARRVFAHQGYAGATIDDVAEAAGYSKGAYYFHFASKEEILLALIDEWTAEREERLADAARGTRPVAEALVHLFEVLFSTDGANAALVLEFWAQGERNPNVRRRLARAEHAWRGRLIQALRRAKDVGALASDITPEEAADTALALHRGFVTQGSARRNGKGLARSRANVATALLLGRRALRATG